MPIDITFVDGRIEIERTPIAIRAELSGRFPVLVSETPLPPPQGSVQTQFSTPRRSIDGVSTAALMIPLMRKHLRWIAPFVTAVVVLVAAPQIAMNVTRAADQTDPASVGPATLIALGLLAIGVIAPVALTIVAIVQAAKIRRANRHRRGQFTAAELAIANEQDRRQRVWNDAAHFRQCLLARQVPASLQQWEVVPLPGEVFFEDAPMTYARYYGQDVVYSQSSTFAFGHPAFVVGALTAGAIGNAVSRSQAVAASREQWREWQTTRVLVTNHRLIVYAGGRWLSFDYGRMTAIYPEVASNTLVCQFDSSEPLMLQGPHAVKAAIMAVFATRGPDGLAQHPSLTPLDPVPR